MSALVEESLQIAGPKELIIMEGMMPKDRWGTSTTNSLSFLKLGFEIELVDFSYDDYACHSF